MLGLQQQIGIGSIDSARHVGAAVQLEQKNRTNVAKARLRQFFSCAKNTR